MQYSCEPVIANTFATRTSEPRAVRRGKKGKQRDDENEADTKEISATLRTTLAEKPTSTSAALSPSLRCRRDVSLKVISPRSIAARYATYVFERKDIHFQIARIGMADTGIPLNGGVGRGMNE